MPIYILAGLFAVLIITFFVFRNSKTNPDKALFVVADALEKQDMQTLNKFVDDPQGTLGIVANMDQAHRNMYAKSFREAKLKNRTANEITYSVTFYPALNNIPRQTEIKVFRRNNKENWFMDFYNVYPRPMGISR